MILMIKMVSGMVVINVGLGKLKKRKNVIMKLHNYYLVMDVVLVLLLPPMQ